MRLTFLLTQHLESPGGGGRFFPLAKELAALGHEVTIVALHPDFAAVPPAERRFVREGVRVVYVAQMHVRKVAGEKSYFRPWQLIGIVLWATLQLTRAAWHTPADALWVGKTQPMNLLAGWLVRLGKRLPVYVDSDDYEAEHNRFGGRWQQRLVAWFEDWPVRWAAGFSVGNQYIYARYRALGVPPERLYLLYNGVDEARFANLTAEATAALRQRLPFSPAARVVVYVGSLRLTTHAVDLLLEAWTAVVSSEPQARLVLVGGGEDMLKVRQLVATLGLTEVVHFVGPVPVADVPLYYTVGEFSVDPRRVSLAAEASFSLKLVESIAAGVPCITSDIGDRAEVGGQACLAIPPDDAPALAQAILHLLHDPQQLATMRQAAQAIQPSLWWPTRTKGLVRQLLAERKLTER